MATVGAPATTIVDGGGKTGELFRYRRLSRICMPFIEWTCVAAIPTWLSIKKTERLPETTILAWSKNNWSWFKFLTVEGDVDDATSHTCGSIGSSLRQRMLLAPVITAVLSFTAILLFGDIHCDDNNGCASKSRGMGIVMGTHLIPLFYLAIQLFLVSGDNGGPDITSHSASKQTTFDSCSVEVGDCQAQTIPTTGTGLDHLRFASMGGFSFVISYIWSQCNHHKFICNRFISVAGVDQTSDDTSNHNGLTITRLKENQPRRSTSVMNICWKVYLLLAISQSTHAASCGHNASMLLLGAIHLLLIRIYGQKTDTLTKYDKAITRGAWQDAFTPGEWMAVSTLITSLAGEYIFEYSGMVWISNTEASSFYNSLSLHLIVAHSGLVGCLIGVIAWTFLKKSLLICSGVSWNNTKKLGMAVSLGTVAGITIVCLEVALSLRPGEAAKYKCADLNVPMILCGYDILSSLQWLFHFLSSELTMHGSACSVSRVAVLGYWACILAVCLPLASKLAPWITDGKEITVGDSSNRNGANGDHIHNHSEKEEKKRVVIARKYFHLIAILLFTPITLLDADMMALSYAIATALLIVLEIARGWMFTGMNNTKAGSVAQNTGKMSWNQLYMVFLDEKDSSAANGGLAVTHIALVAGCAFPLWANQLFQQTYHKPRALLPSQSPLGSSFHSDETLLPLLPLLGVLVLGIGDSAGAIWGMKFGRHRWPGGSSRTLEGSLCMFLSMLSVIFGYSAFTAITTDAISYALRCMFQASLLLGLITLVEASTTQIDNLSLPIAGSTMVFLFTDYPNIRA